MYKLMLCLAFFAIQMNTLQDKPVVRLRPHQDTIAVEFNGKLLELINAPDVVRLPFPIPRADNRGVPWSVDVKNFGPASVRVTDKSHFSVEIKANQTKHIYSSGDAYFSK
jgi:hypothetical protein